jgi:hypothetical protein
MNEQLDLGDLVKYNSPSVLAQEQIRLQFLEMLLGDTYLVQYLERREAWTFRSMTSLAQIFRFVPTYHLFARFVIFVKFPGFLSAEESFLNVAIFSLSVCKCLCALYIANTEETVPLDTIVAACPQLKWLIIQNVPSVTGSIASLAQLSRFDFIDREDYRILPPISSILPIGSCDCLKLLTFIIHDLPDEYQRALPNALKSFKNLTSLSIDPLTDELVDYLLATQIQLTEFKLHFTDNHALSPDQIQSLFYAPCLRNLRSLDLEIQYCPPDTRPYYEEYNEGLIRNITRLSELEYLKLEIPLDMAWSGQFANLNNLKKLVWELNADQYYGSNPELPARRLSKFPDRISEHAREQFRVVFSHFARCPAITINVSASVLRRWYPEDYPESEGE